MTMMLERKRALERVIHGGFTSRPSILTPCVSGSRGGRVVCPGDIDPLVTLHGLRRVLAH